MHIVKIALLNVVGQFIPLLRSEDLAAAKRMLVVIAALDPIHPDPSQADFMPYAPAVNVQGAGETLYISGATASPRPGTQTLPLQASQRAATTKRLLPVSWSGAVIRAESTARVV